MNKTVFTGKKSVYIIWGVIAVALSLVFMAIFSLAVYFFNIDRGYLPFLSTLSVAAGCFASSYFAAKKLCEKGYLIGIITGGIAFFVITVISFILGEKGITLNTLFHLVIIMLASVIGGITGVNKGSKRII